MSRDRKSTSELNEFKFKNIVIFIYFAVFAAHFLWMLRNNTENKTSKSEIK